MWISKLPSLVWPRPARRVVALVGDRRVPCEAYAAGRVRGLEVEGPPGWWVEGGTLAVSRRRGSWLVRWPDGVALPLRAVTAGEFDDSLRVTATLVDGDGVGPCFAVESAVAGRARLEVRAVGRDVSSVHEVTLGAGPALIAPGTLPDVDGVEAFVLLSGRREVGRLDLRAPAASFTAEGWFDAAPEFEWGDAAEREVLARLGRLSLECGD